jgi:hypothetical protein
MKNKYLKKEEKQVEVKSAKDVNKKIIHLESNRAVVVRRNSKTGQLEKMIYPLEPFIEYLKKKDIKYLQITQVSQAHIDFLK